MSASLPALPTGADTRSIVERVNRLIREQNRIEVDTFAPVYAAETGTGTAYVMNPVPGIEQYIVGQVFAFKATNANTGTAPTLAVNGLTAGTIVPPSGGALVAGEIAAGGMVQVQVAAVSSGTPTFHLLTPRAPLAAPAAIGSQSVIAYLGSNLSLTAGDTFYSGPSTGGIGAAGQKWLIVSSAVMSCVTVAATFENAIYNGSSYIANQTVVNPSVNNWPVSATASAIVTLSGATTFTARYSSNGGFYSANPTVNCSSWTGVGANTASYIYAVRLS